jgi:ribonuclease BN (tRNA processing enzyme)
MILRLIVLGCYGPYPPAGGACSGYLVYEDGHSLLIDCGNGVLSRLQEHLKFWKLNAAIISHLHADHYSDLMIMRYGLEIAFAQNFRSGPLPLYAPAEPASEFERLPYKNAYTVKGINDGEELKLGPFTIKFKAGVHAVRSLAMRIESSSGTMVYSGDTEYFQEFELFAAGVDTLLCEANYLEADIENNLPNHLSSAQAARIAAAAGVKKLLLTHHHPERDTAASLTEAAKYFPTAELAREGTTYDIPLEN